MPNQEHILKPIIDDLARLQNTAESLKTNLDRVTDEIFHTGIVPRGIKHGKLRDVFPTGTINIFGEEVKLPETGMGLLPISELLRSLSTTREQIDKSLEEAKRAILKAAELPQPQRTLPSPPKRLTGR